LTNNKHFARRSQWVQLVALSVGGVVYVFGVRDLDPDRPARWLVLFTAVVLAIVVAHVYGHAHAALTTPRTATRRDDPPSVRGSQLFASVLVSGMIATTALLILDFPRTWAVHTLVVTLLTSEAARVALRLTPRAARGEADR
jgi:hypothetical protein